MACYFSEMLLSLFRQEFALKNSKKGSIKPLIMSSRFLFKVAEHSFQVSMPNSP